MSLPTYAVWSAIWLIHDRLARRLPNSLCSRLSLLAQNGHTTATRARDSVTNPCGSAFPGGAKPEARNFLRAS